MCLKVSVVPRKHELLIVSIVLDISDYCSSGKYGKIYSDHLDLFWFLSSSIEVCGFLWFFFFPFLSSSK